MKERDTATAGNFCQLIEDVFWRCLVSLGSE